MAAIQLRATGSSLYRDVTLFVEKSLRDIGFSDFIHCPGIKKQTKEKHDVSETGSVSVLR
jgi:hypothetical protein